MQPSGDLTGRYSPATSVAWMSGRPRPTRARVRAELNRGRNPLGVKVGDEFAAVPLGRHEFHGERNYTVRPAA